MRGRIGAGCVALVAGVGAAVGVATGADGGCCPITIDGASVAAERQGGIVLTVRGPAFEQGAVGELPITISGNALKSTATAGRDASCCRPQVVTISGRTPSATFTVGVVDDEADEPDERFHVDAKGPELADGTPGPSTSHVLTIADDDGALDAVLCATPARAVLRMPLGPLFGGCSP